MAAVLCVDANPAMQLLYRDMFLKERSVRVYTAGSGEQARGILGGTKGIDALVTERALCGDDDGIGLCRDTVRRYRIPAGLVHSAYEDKVLCESDLQAANASGILEKPFGAQELRSFVHGLLVQREKRKPRILIVDDDESTLTMYGLAFEGGGYEVATAPDGRKALSLLRRGHYDIVLTDVRMPHVSGIELATRLDKSVPVIIGTARWEEDDRSAARQSGAVALYSKPFPVIDLVRMVTKYFPALPNGKGKAL